MRTVGTLVSVVLRLASAAIAAPSDPMLPVTLQPILYQFGYTDRYFTDGACIERFKAAPPDLLQVGKAVPITHLWGPVDLWAGENQYTGGPNNTLNLKGISLLTPEALSERIEHIRQTLVRYHAVGIREIVPYISFHAIAGDHQKRLGFWNFYDQWARYEKWVGPRPVHDPFDWLVVDRRRDFVPGSCGGYTPDYFAPLHRYRGCINHPAWAGWQRRLMRLAAEVGYDGCFIDNSCPDPCFCPCCKNLFRDWLAANRGKGWVSRLAAGVASEKLTLDSDRTPAELVRRWRIQCAAEHLGTLRQAARVANSRFTIFPNTGDISEYAAMGSQCDRLMIETPSAPGLHAADLPNGGEQLAELPCIDHVAELLYAQHMHARAIRLLDYRVLEHERSYASDPQFLNEMALYYLDYRLEKRWDNVQELSLAEMAAFSGGGGVAADGRPYLTYRAFFKKYPELFGGWQLTAPAAVLYAYWGPNPLSSQPGSARQPIHAQLTADHRPYVPLVDASLPDRAEELTDFAVIYLVSPRYEMSPGQFQSLRNYAGHGRVVLASKDVTINGRPAVELLARDRVAIWDLNNPATPTTPIASTEGIRKNLRFAIYQKADRLTVHAVNYNVCLRSPRYQVLEVDATPLAIPLPIGWRAAGATCFDPGAATEALPCTVTEGVARLTLPKLHIYKIVLLERHE